MSRTPGGPGADPTEWIRLARNFFGRDMAEFLVWLDATYGDVTRVYNGVLREHVVTMSRPSHVEAVLKSQQDAFRKSRFSREYIGEVFGDGLLTSEGERWEQQRRRLSPLFGSDELAGYRSDVSHGARDLVERWRRSAEDGDTVAVRPAMERLTLDVIGRTLFGVDVEPYRGRIRRATRIFRRVYQRRTASIVPTWLPLPLNLWGYRAMRTFDDVVREIVDEITSRPEPGGLVGSLVERGVDGQRLRDHVGTFLLAGYETTAATLTWTLYLTARHGAVQERLRRDDTPVGDRVDPSGDAPGVTRRVVMESMRLFPPIPYIVREVDSDVDVDGYGLGAGEQVLVPQIVTHRDAGLWDDPLAFDPDRFAGDADRPPFSFYPFGGGRRICIGRPLALMEATTVLSAVVDAFELADETGVAPSDQGLETAITMFPESPVRLSLTER